MQYPHIFKHSPALDLRIPMTFLDAIRQYVSVPDSRQTHNKRLPLSYYE